MADIKYIITADASGAVKGIKAVDDSVDGMAKQAKKSVSPLKGMWKQMAAGIGITSLITMGLQTLKRQVSDMITKGVEFGREWANVTTMLSISQEETDKLRSELLELSPTLGDTTELARAMYQVLSASIEPAEAIELLGTAAKAAKAGLTEAEVAVDALTTVINAYGLEASDATEISDIMFQTVKMGKLTYEQLASSLGTVVPVAAQVGIGFDEIAAALATMTKQGIDTNTATMQLRQIMMSILNPGKDATDMAESLGLEFDATALKTKGLSGFIEDMMEATEGSTEKIIKLIPESRAVTGVLALGGAAAEDFADGLRSIRTESGQTEEAFRKQMESAGFWIDATKASIDKLKIAFIEGFTKPILDGIESSEELDETIESLIEKVETFGEALGTLSKYGITPFLTQLDLAITKLQAVNFAKGGSLWSLAQTIVMESIPAFKELKDAIFQADERALKGFNAGIEFGEGILKKFNKAVKDAKTWLSEMGVESDTTSTKIAKLPVPLALTTFEVQKLQSAWTNMVAIWIDNEGVIEDQELALELMKIEAIELGATLKSVMAQIGLDFDLTTEKIETSTEDINEYWDQLTTDIGRSFGGLIDSLLDETTTFEEGWVGFLDSLKASFRAVIAEMVSDWIKEFLTKLVTSTASGIADVGTEIVGGLQSVSAAAAGLWTGIGAAAGTLLAGLITGPGGPSSTDSWHFEHIWMNTQELLNLAFNEASFTATVWGIQLEKMQALVTGGQKRLGVLRDIRKNFKDMPTGQGGLHMQSGPQGGLARYHPYEDIRITPIQNNISMSATPIQIKIGEHEIMNVMVKMIPQYSRMGYLKYDPRGVRGR